jgi:hypothetical protein
MDRRRISSFGYDRAGDPFVQIITAHSRRLTRAQMLHNGRQTGCPYSVRNFDFGDGGPEGKLAIDRSPLYWLSTFCPARIASILEIHSSRFGSDDSE